MTCPKEEKKKVQHQALQKPPTAELWCMADYYCFLCLFILLIQAVTLARRNKWAVASVIEPAEKKK